MPRQGENDFYHITSRGVARKKYLALATRQPVRRRAV